MLSALRAWDARHNQRRLTVPLAQQDELHGFLQDYTRRVPHEPDDLDLHTMWCVHLCMSLATSRSWYPTHREAHEQDQYVRDLGRDLPPRTVCKQVLDVIEEEVHHMCVNCLMFFGANSDRGRGAQGLWNCFDGLFARLRDKYGITALTLDDD